MQNRERDPFAPVEWIVFVLTGLAVLPLLLLPFAVYDAVKGGQPEVQVFQLNDDRACAIVSARDVEGDRRSEPRSLRPGVSAREVETRLCLDQPSLGEQVAAGARPSTTYAMFLGSVLLLRRLMRQARRGLFTASTARSVTVLGSFLAVGSLVAAALGKLGDVVVLRRAVGFDSTWSDLLYGADVSWSWFVVGLGVVTVGRVVRRAVLLQEEVDATV